MGYIYEDMRKAEKEIEASFNGNLEEFRPYIDIIDDKWEAQLGHPLHSAGLFLNPAIFYKDTTFATNHKIWSGFLDAVEVLYFNNEEKIMNITVEIDLYRKSV